jgi:hypothetical protein
MSLFTNISITKVFLEESSNKPFSLIVDGRIVESVVKLKIKSTSLKKKFSEKLKQDNFPIRNLNIPIMSFLPFKV